MVKPLLAVNRLKKPTEFQTVYKNNQVRQKGQYFTVLAFYYCSKEYNIDSLKDDFSYISKLGVVASKKVSKKAVKRNLLKRLMRNAYQNSDLPDRFYFVIIAKPGAEKKENIILREELTYLLIKLRKKCTVYLSSL